jgi:CheY-like chemotaxis protein
MPNVLIADDSIAVRKVAERLLIEAGLGVTLVANGEEALAYLAKETPDLVVSDVIMPDKSGYEVCAFVRGQRTLANIPVLLISGIVNEDVTKQAEVCHADGVLKKPFQGTSLKDRVLELLAKRQSVAAPAVKSAEKAAASIDQNQTARVSDEQLEIYRQAVARLKPLEEEILVERDRATRGSQRVAELEQQLGRAQEIELMLAGERERIAQLKKELEATDGIAAQVQELKSALKAERDRVAEFTNQASLAESLGGQVRELEAALRKERENTAQQASRLTELQKNESHVQELEATLNAERQAATQLVDQITEMEKEVARSRVLAQALVQEQARTGDLTRRLAEAERLSQTIHESEALLQTERERNSLLVKRVSESELATEQATKRFEEMAIKLGEIAGLASQLGNGKRRF